MVEVFGDATGLLEKDIHKQPIVAWRIRCFEPKDGSPDRARAEPVGAETLFGDYWILDPTGQVTMPECAGYESLEAFHAAEMKKRQQAWALESLSE